MEILQFRSTDDHRKKEEEEYGDVVSDCESCTSSSNVGDSADTEINFSGTVKLNEEEAVYTMISQKFMSDLAGLGIHANLDSIYRCENSNLKRQAKLEVFSKLLQATEQKNGGGGGGGSDCWKYAWYCGSKKDVHTILSYGFGHDSIIDNGIYGRGVYLSPFHRPLQSLNLSIPDENGLRHFLLCRVIIGSMELVPPGSRQCHPSSEEFDSGVDNLILPTKYIVWSTHMNTHILPEFVVSIRGGGGGVPPIGNTTRLSVVSVKKPSSPWVPLSMLISILSKYLPQKSIKRIQKYHTDYREGKIVRQEMIKQVRRITGDMLLFGVIKAYSEQMRTSSMGRKPPNVSSPKLG